MPSARIGLLAGRRELGEGERLDRPEESEPDAQPSTGHRPTRRQALVDERDEVVDECVGRLPARRGDGRDLVEVEPTLEHREPAQEALLPSRQEIVAPADRAIEGALTAGRVPWGRPGEGEVGGEPIADRSEGEQGDPGCGELDPEREPVEQVADLAHRRGLIPGLPSRTNRSGAFHEQAVRRDATAVRSPDGGPVERFVLTERPDGIVLFTGDVEGRATGDDDPRAR